ncbi:MAG: cyclic-di-AMP receptor [Clostridia bacterium]
MKLIFAIVNHDDSNTVAKALRENSFSATKLATTGGFLMRGNVTFIIGTDDDKVDTVIKIISDHSKERKEVVPATASYGMGVYNPYPVEVTVGGATIFVTNVEKFEKV